MRRLLRSACAVAAVVLAVPAVARAAAGTADQAGSSSPVGVRAYGIVDLDAVAAKQSFEAVLGTSQLRAFGGGVDVVNIWKHVFVRAAVTRARKTGIRAVVSGGLVFPNGIPLTLTLTPVEVGGGWRFATAGRVTPYFGVAFLSMGYTERSKFAEPGEDTDERFKGQDVFGGAEVGIARWLVASGEAQYRRVPNALSAGGISTDFGESDLGGFTVRFSIGIRTAR
jgi:hypothetical protein